MTQKLLLYNKTEWPDGPWQYESDLIRWIDLLTQYPCFMSRIEKTGAWAGAVGIPTTHPLYQTMPADPIYASISVHGGISFAGFITVEDRWVVPPQRRWWIGFDCDQEFDILPCKTPKTDDARMVYRDEEYVHLEVAYMAQQLQLMERFDD